MIKNTSIAFITFVVALGILMFEPSPINIGPACFIGVMKGFVFWTEHRRKNLKRRIQIFEEIMTLRQRLRTIRSDRAARDIDQTILETQEIMAEIEAKSRKLGMPGRFSKP